MSDDDYNVYRVGYISLMRDNKKFQFIPYEMDFDVWMKPKLIKMVIDKYGFERYDLHMKK